MPTQGVNFDPLHSAENQISLYYKAKQNILCVMPNISHQPANRYILDQNITNSKSRKMRHHE